MWPANFPLHPPYFCWQLAFYRHIPTSGRQNTVKTAPQLLFVNRVFVALYVTIILPVGPIPISLYLSSLSTVFSSIFWAIFGQKPLRVHQWDVLESISGVLDPYRGHFSQKNRPRSQNFDFFLPKKSFYENAHISGTRRPTGLAQVSKRPLEQGLRA